MKCCKCKCKRKPKAKKQEKLRPYLFCDGQNHWLTVNDAAFEIRTLQLLVKHLEFELEQK